MKGKLTVLLDTNFLVDVIRFKLDLKEELSRILDYSYETFVVPSVLAELRMLAAKGNDLARLALKLLEKTETKKFYTDYEGHADEIMLNACKDNKEIAVATGDRNLRERLESIGAKTIYIRAKKHLAID